ncbi:glycosyl transferase [candidate division KSB3 bacterium]|uniref:dolichyl-phosphate beta-glucosyltransferase n=1 Tax=candidate division KSB3 bacterium TaxID=2044937 RepID=A0A2G6E623_9BACT|nr:MAG: glycosyl transferase [candidate division KSB3 bacterium]PIE29770.1 MAG: glycosyl transferase [candidate division KSB3 bacterium]
MTSTIFLSVVIPAYNEEARLPGSLKRIARYLGQQDYLSELIVVDDGSSDATVEKLRSMPGTFGTLEILENTINRGKGFSVRRGILHSRGEYVVFSDADLSTPIEEVEKLLPFLQDSYDIAIGSRALRESDIRVHQPWYREGMGKVFNRLARALKLTPFSDTQCGFKCFRGAVAHDIAVRQRIDHFSFDVEILFIAAHLNYRVKEVPIQWFDEPHSRVHAFYDAVHMFRDLLKIRYYALKGHYD